MALTGGELKLRLGFDGNKAIAGIKSAITQFGILRASGGQLIDTFREITNATVGTGLGINKLTAITRTDGAEIQRISKFFKGFGISVEEAQSKVLGLFNRLSAFKLGKDSEFGVMLGTFGLNTSPFQDPTKLLMDIGKRYNELIAGGNEALADEMVRSLGVQDLVPAFLNISELSDFDIPVLNKENVESLTNLSREMSKFGDILKGSFSVVVAENADRIASAFKGINEALLSMDTETLGYLVGVGGAIGSGAILKGGAGLLGGAGGGALGGIGSLVLKVGAVSLVATAVHLTTQKVLQGVGSFLEAEDRADRSIQSAIYKSRMIKGRELGYTDKQLADYVFSGVETLFNDKDLNTRFINDSSVSKVNSDNTTTTNNYYNGFVENAGSEIPVIDLNRNEVNGFGFGVR